MWGLGFRGVAHSEGSATIPASRKGAWEPGKAFYKLGLFLEHRNKDGDLPHLNFQP